MKTELEKLKKEIETDLAAVNQLIARCEKQREAKPIIAALIEASSPKKPTSQIVEDLIKRQRGDFDIPDICFQYTKETGRPANEHVRLAISQVINKLKHRNLPEIDEVEKGRGSRSGKYKYVKP